MFWDGYGSGVNIPNGGSYVLFDEVFLCKITEVELVDEYVGSMTFHVMFEMLGGEH